MDVHTLTVQVKEAFVLGAPPDVTEMYNKPPQGTDLYSAIMCFEEIVLTTTVIITIWAKKDLEQDSYH